MTTPRLKGKSELNLKDSIVNQDKAFAAIVSQLSKAQRSDLVNRIISMPSFSSRVQSIQQPAESPNLYGKQTTKETTTQSCNQPFHK